MVFLRSEEHLARWLERNGWSPGASMSAVSLAELASRWWRTRLDPDWLPRPAADSQAILDELGLTGPFWSLAPFGSEAATRGSG